MTELLQKLLVTALRFPRLVFSAVSAELIKETKSHPLTVLFRVLAHFTRVADGEEADYTFITAKQIKAEQAIRDIFGSDRVCGVANYRDLHVALREDKPFDEAKWELASQVLEENQGTMFRTRVRDWDKFINLYEFVFPHKKGAAEQMIIWFPEPEKEKNLSLMFLAALLFLALAYYEGGFIMLLFATMLVYAINVHLHHIISLARKAYPRREKA